jgi:uncharacterized MAPEG superfamily protein
MVFPALVTTIALIEYMAFTMRVGLGRAQYGVDAPATSGHPEWERMYRVQQNTLEQLVVFLPALWLFSTFLSPTVGGAIGLLFIVGRPLYAIHYVHDPPKRTLGFLLGFVSNVLLVLGALGGTLKAIF